MYRWPLELRYLNMLEISHLFDETYFPYEVRLDEDQAGVFIRHWPTVMVDTSRNFSYSLQWFAMSIASAYRHFYSQQQYSAVNSKALKAHLAPIHPFLIRPRNNSINCLYFQAINSLLSLLEIHSQ